MFCAPTLDSTSCRIYGVPCLLGAVGNCARWLLKNSHLCDNNHLQSAREISSEVIVNSRSKFFTVRINESGPRSRDHSKFSLETEKNSLLYCRLKKIQMGKEMVLWVTVSTKGESTRLCHKRNEMCHFDSGSIVADCQWRRFYFENREGFSFS